MNVRYNRIDSFSCPTSNRLPDGGKQLPCWCVNSAVDHCTMNPNGTEFLDRDERPVSPPPKFDKERMDNYLSHCSYRCIEPIDSELYKEWPSSLRHQDAPSYNWNEDDWDKRESQFQTITDETISCLPVSIVSNDYVRLPTPEIVLPSQSPLQAFKTEQNSAVGISCIPSSCVYQNNSKKTHKIVAPPKPLSLSTRFGCSSPVVDSIQLDSSKRQVRDFVNDLVDVSDTNNINNDNKRVAIKPGTKEEDFGLELSFSSEDDTEDVRLPNSSFVDAFELISFDHCPSTKHRSIINTTGDKDSGLGSPNGRKKSYFDEIQCLNDTIIQQPIVNPVIMADLIGLDFGLNTTTSELFNIQIDTHSDKVSSSTVANEQLIQLLTPTCIDRISPGTSDIDLPEPPIFTALPQEDNKTPKYEQIEDEILFVSINDCIGASSDTTSNNNSSSGTVEINLPNIKDDSATSVLSEALGGTNFSQCGELR